jgi:hypothetical protein
VLLVLVVLLAVVTVPLTGGRLSRLATVDLRLPGLAVVGLFAQVIVISVFPDLPAWVAITVHFLSYGLVLAFIWCNRHLAGMWLLALGGLSNLVVIAANGGVMPASADALRTAGRSPNEAGFTNSEVLDDARLQFLGDVIPMPSWMPLANVFSVGDVLIAVGVFWCVHAICRGHGIHEDVGTPPPGTPPPGTLE